MFQDFVGNLYSQIFVSMNVWLSNELSYMVIATNQEPTKLHHNKPVKFW